MRSLRLFVLITLAAFTEASSRFDEASFDALNEDRGEQKLPVSTICGTEAFAQRWKLFDYRESADSSDLVALARTSPGDLALIVRQLKAPLWTNRTAAAKALGMSPRRQPRTVRPSAAELTEANFHEE